MNFQAKSVEVVEDSLLAVNAAVASRIIRSAIVPREYFCWLANPSKIKTLPSVPAVVNATLRKSIDELLDPVLEDAAPWELKETRNAAQWLAAINQFVAEKYTARGIEFATRMLAMSLLPLYRTLATGKLQEGFQQTRLRLAEVLSLLSLCDELNDDKANTWSSCGLAESLEVAFREKKMPAAVLKDCLELDIGRIGELVLMYAAEFDATRNDFPASVRADFCDASNDASTVTAEWAAPDLLWRLSGELMSKKSDMVLPRAWIETPVPWTSIGDHWNSLSHTLSKLGSEALNNTATSSKTTTQDQPSIPADDSTKSVKSTPKTETSTSAENEKNTTDRTVMPKATEATMAVSADDLDASRTTDDSFEQIEDRLVEVDTVMGEDNQLDDAAKPELKASPASTPDSIVPKVLIAEIRSHNDPAFVNVLKRQIANCRADDRTVCLAKVVVLPEDESDREDICGVRDNGMTLWQQKLVNWLADRENVAEPYAFITSDGELLLCVLDMERNEMTSTLRCGLIEVLTGQHIEDAGEMSLAKVHVPARFHAGIASASSPGSNFTPEQLIEPAIRCLSAASRQGKTSIKSIEVF